jgi:ribonuclease P protein component
MGRATAMPGWNAELRRLLKRSQFLRAARGNRAGRSAFLLQAIGSDDAEPGLGFTVTKKIGNAPERNRIKRRLREAARACEALFRPRHDYVLVGRREALTMPFARLVTELSGAVIKIHETKIHASQAASLRDDK